MLRALTSKLMASPALYHHVRQVATGGFPFRFYAREYGLTDPAERVADLGCGPADLLRYVGPGRRPAFYLGLDVSGRYLGAARRRAERAGVPAEFLVADLDRIPTDAAARQRVLDLLAEHRITTVLLLGVVHHIDDAAALATLRLVHAAPTVRRLLTWDTVVLPGHRVNNLFAARDRGEHVRAEPAYDALAAASPWPRRRKFWSSPRLSFIRYIHFDYTKDAPAETPSAEERPAP